MPDSNAQSHWIRTKQLMLLMLALWLLFSVVVHLFVVPLNRIIIPYLDLPLGFFMAAQGGADHIRDHAVRVRATAGPDRARSFHRSWLNGAPGRLSRG
jgi:putative solute:sodium symporter small subunit